MKDKELIKFFLWVIMTQINVGSFLLYNWTFTTSWCRSRLKFTQLRSHGLMLTNNIGTLHVVCTLEDSSVHNSSSLITTKHAVNDWSVYFNVIYGISWQEMTRTLIGAKQYWSQTPNPSINITCGIKLKSVGSLLTSFFVSEYKIT